jgi:mannose-6-phosphate isomerase-like protein (cupin superfamily)
MKIASWEEAVLEAKRLAKKKLAMGENADEFKLYITAGKTIRDYSPVSFHENPRDVFMLVLKGEAEFTFAQGEKTVVKTGECFVLPKHLEHHCAFKKMTIAFEGVYARGL